MASNDDILFAIGGLKTAVEQLRADFSEEKRLAHENRKSIHERLDQQVTQTAYLDKSVAVQAGIDAQMRDKIESLEKTVKSNHEAVSPTIDDMRRLKMVGWTISGLIAMGGLSVGGLVALAGENVVTTVRHWLKIP